MKTTKFKNESTGAQIDADKIKKIEALLDIKKTNPFGTEDESEFKDQMESMTTSDLQNLCRKLSLVPRTNREKIKEQLLNQFRSVSRSSRLAFVQSSSSTNIPSDKLLQLIKD